MNPSLVSMSERDFLWNAAIIDHERPTVFLHGFFFFFFTRSTRGASKPSSLSSSFPLVLMWFVKYKCERTLESAATGCWSFSGQVDKRRRGGVIATPKMLSPLFRPWGQTLPQCWHSGMSACACESACVPAHPEVLTLPPAGFAWWPQSESSLRNLLFFRSLR